MITASGSAERTRNPLRPERLADVIGQDNAKALMRRALMSTAQRNVPLDHILLVGASGTGKTTFSHCIANELGVDVFEIEAPISYDTLAELRTTMRDFDILKIEEIHMQAVMERRGMTASARPEVLFSVLEDRTLQSPNGPLPFPHITVIGTTTDEGMLPDPFLNRFPLRPVLDPYTDAELFLIAEYAAAQLRLPCDRTALRVLVGAARGVPREIGNLIRNAQVLCADGLFTADAALAVLEVNRITPDGLTLDMQNMLTFLYERAQRTNGAGETVYQASVNTIATAIGKSRDTKAVALRVEPYLIRRGLIQVGHGGRSLTQAGVERAKELLRA